MGRVLSIIAGMPDINDVESWKGPFATADVDEALEFSCSRDTQVCTSMALKGSVEDRSVPCC